MTTDSLSCGFDDVAGGVVNGAGDLIEAAVAACSIL